MTPPSGAPADEVSTTKIKGPLEIRRTLDGEFLMFSLGSGTHFSNPLRYVAALI